jgi:hypothetical protein
MRTTVAINDNLLASAKERAAAQGVSLGRVIEDGLRLLVGRPEPSERPDIPVLRGEGGLRRGVDATSNRALFEILDEGRPVDQLR